MEFHFLVLLLVNLTFFLLQLLLSNNRKEKQKIVKDNFTAFAQVMLQNGGRNGVTMNGGIHWYIGKKNNIEKVESLKIQ